MLQVSRSKLDGFGWQEKQSRMIAEADRALCRCVARVSEWAVLIPSGWYQGMLQCF
jgi:hypothetical protein